MPTYTANALDALLVDSPNLDAFGRVRVSQPVTLFDSKQIFDKQPLFWDESLESGADINSTHSTATASSVIASTLNTAGKFTRQTFQRFNYQPGKSQLVLMTGVLDRTGGGTGVTRRIGMFDDKNGLFFEDAEGTVRVVRRSYVTGSAVDTGVAQTAWNIDKLDGTGPSGFVADWTKTQIFSLDYEWLGVGRVRFGLVIDGAYCLVHEFLNANNLTTVYISTPNLPLGYQLITTASSPASSMEAICASVVSEGGNQNTGVLRYLSTAGTHVDCNAANSLYAILGIRLKSTHVAAFVNVVNVSVAEHVGAKDLEWVVMLNGTIAGSPSWSAVTNSALEYFTGATENTVTGGTALFGGHFSTAINVGSASGETVTNAIRLGASIAGTVDTIVLAARPIGGSSNADVEGSITWRESP